MKLKATDLMDRWVICEDLDVGRIKNIIVDMDENKITHFEVQLTKDASEVVFGARKRGIRNFLAISSMEKGAACCDSGNVDLKIKKSQLNMYLKAPNL